jgi:hypothetical protein
MVCVQKQPLLNRYKITLDGQDLLGLADTHERALKLGRQLARQHEGQRVIGTDTTTGALVFRFRYGCENCD